MPGKEDMEHKLCRLVFSMVVALFLFSSACVPPTLEVPISITTSIPTVEVSIDGFTHEEIATLLT